MRNVWLLAVSVAIVVLLNGVSNVSWGLEDITQHVFPSIDLNITQNELASTDQPVPESAALDDGSCRNIDSLMPGSFENGSWVSENCEFRPLNISEVQKCLENKIVLVVGDSQLRSLTTSAATAFGLSRMKKGHHDKPIKLVAPGSKKSPLQFFWKPSVNFRGFKNYYPPRKNQLAATDHLIFNDAMSDIGRYGCGVQVFYTRLLKQMRLYKAAIPSEAVFSLFVLHWIWLDPTICSELCRKCNSPAKLAAFREATLLAASCSGISLIDTSKVTRSMGMKHSYDGVHLSGSALRLQLDIVAHNICRPRDVPFTSSNPIRCSDEAVIRKKWETIPEAETSCATIPIDCSPEGGEFGGI